MTSRIQNLTLALLALAVAAIYGTYLLRADESPDVSHEAQATPALPVSNDFPLAGESAPAAAAPAPTIPARSLSEGLFDDGDWRGRPALVDLNDDGRLDLVASLRRWDNDRPGEGLYVWLGDGAGTWKQSIRGLRRDMGYGGASVTDMDGDGDLDIAFSGHDVTPRVFAGDGDGNWEETSVGIVTEGPCQDVAMGDMDGDGRCELITVGFFSESGGLLAFSRAEDGSWEFIEELLPKENFGAQARLVDLEGDGKLELLAVTDLGAKVWGFEDGVFVDRSNGLPQPHIGGSDLAVDALDFDGDGAKELVLSGMMYDGHPPLRIFRLEDGEWRSWGDGLPDDEAFFDFEFGDVDGDGRQEILAAGKQGINVIAMTSPGQFERLGRVDDTYGVIHLTAGDVNDDGRDEVVYVGFGSVRVLELDLGGAL